MSSVALRVLDPKVRAFGIPNAGDPHSLQNVDTSELPDGAMCVVLDTHTIYVLDFSASGGGNNVPPLSGPGFWEPITGTLFSLLAFDLTGPSIVEVGETVATPAFSAVYDTAPTTATLTDDAGSAPKDVSGTPTAFSSAGTFTKNAFGQSVVFTLTATKDVSVQRTTTLSWGQLDYWGVDVAGQSGAPFIQGLSNSALAITRGIGFTVTAGPTDKIYFATRTAYGTPNFFDADTGFLLAISKVGDFAVTNSHGFTENYQLWESDNVGLGQVMVEVS